MQPETTWTQKPVFLVKPYTNVHKYDLFLIISTAYHGDMCDLSILLLYSKLPKLHLCELSNVNQSVCVSYAINIHYCQRK